MRLVIAGGHGKIALRLERRAAARGDATVALIRDPAQADDVREAGAEPVVAVVDKVVDRHGTRALAEAYLRFLYTPDGQDLAAKHSYRPIDPAVAARYARQFPQVPTFTVDEVFGGWRKAQPEFFGNGGVFDQIYQPGGR